MLEAVLGAASKMTLRPGAGAWAIYEKDIRVLPICTGSNWTRSLIHQNADYHALAYAPQKNTSLLDDHSHPT